MNFTRERDSDRQNNLFGFNALGDSNLMGICKYTYRDKIIVYGLQNGLK